jgi:hypothetical protein
MYIQIIYDQLANPLLHMICKTAIAAAATSLLWNARDLYCHASLRYIVLMTSAYLSTCKYKSCRLLNIFYGGVLFTGVNVYRMCCTSNTRRYAFCPWFSQPGMLEGSIWLLNFGKDRWQLYSIYTCLGRWKGKMLTYFRYFIPQKMSSRVCFVVCIMYEMV